MRRYLLLVMLLLLAAGAAAADVISVDVPTCTTTFSHDASGDHVSAPGFTVVDDPGNPGVLVKSMYVLLPPNADPASVTVSFIPSQFADLGSTYDLAPAPPHAILADDSLDWGQDKNIVNGRNTLVYGVDGWSVPNQASLSDVSDMRQYRLAHILYYPLSYNPASNDLQGVLGGQIQVSYDIDPNASLPEVPETTGSAFFDQQLQGMVCNYDTAIGWYSSGSSALGSSALDVSSLPSTADYVILTTQSIVNSSSKLQDFVDEKTDRGFTVAIATEADYNPNNHTGQALANDIHAWLASHWSSMGIIYVLLIGNPDPINGDLPMKMLYATGYYTRPEDGYPSDTWYSCLNGNWDLNNDGFFGESPEDIGTGGIDYHPTVYVGRIPYYGCMTELDHILDKTMKYESVQGIVNHDPGAGGDWARKTLLSVQPPFSQDDFTPTETVRNNYVLPNGFIAARVYGGCQDQHVIWPPYGFNNYNTCTNENVLACWNPPSPDTPPGIHFWSAHGSTSLAACVFDSGHCRNPYPQSSCDRMFTGCLGLDDTHPCFVWSASCNNGWPEDPCNLAYVLLNEGAVGVVAASRPSGYPASMGQSFVQQMIMNHTSSGIARDSSGMGYTDGYTMNLYGDPSLSLQVGGPWIVHNEILQVDDTTQPYRIEATVQPCTKDATVTGATVYWSCTGPSNYVAVPMTNTGGNTWVGYIPNKPWGTNIHYYIQATDSLGLVSTHPTRAPGNSHCISVLPDVDPPSISPSVLPHDTAALPQSGYSVRVLASDSYTGVDSVVIHYRVNGGTESTVSTQCSYSAYSGAIPGPVLPGDVITYYVTATDKSMSHNASRYPADPSAYESFSIINKVAVLVYDPMFYQYDLTPLNADSQHRMWSVASDPSAVDGYDVLLLGSSTGPSQGISDWFVPGKSIVMLSGGFDYGWTSHFLWPNYTGNSPWNLLCNTWNRTYDSQGRWCVSNQQIVRLDPIVKGHALNDVIPCESYYELYKSQLGTDVTVLAQGVWASGADYAVDAYRDVPDHGRIVVLLGTDPMNNGPSKSFIVEACARQVEITSPAGGASFQTGDTISINYKTTGPWRSFDRVRLEYTCDTVPNQAYYQIPGAEALQTGTQSFAWSITNDLPASSHYKIRASLSSLETAANYTTGDFTINGSTIIRVSTSGVDTNDGSSWALAKRTIASALDSASEGTQVWVAVGTYNECTLELKNGVRLMGGFSGTDTIRDWNQHVTTISDGGYITWTDADSTPATVLEGFHITGGGYYIGGGCIAEGSPTIRHNVFSGCNAQYVGGAICTMGGSVQIIDNVFSGCYVEVGDGGAIGVQSGSPLIVNNTFENGSGPTGGSIYIASGASPVISNNIIYGGQSGYGIYNSGGTPALSHNDLFGNLPGNYHGVSPGTGDISADPLFTDLWHLAYTSPCIDAGDDSAPSLAVTDMDGQARVFGAHVDIGADEVEYGDVVLTSPSDGATNVRVSSMLSATFSKAMAGFTITTDTFVVKDGNNNQINGSVSYNSGTKTATFTPASPLAAGTTYTATITTGVEVLYGPHLSSNYTWGFATSSGVYHALVKSEASGSVHDGSSWTNAFLTIADGINAVGPGEEVWVAAGTYSGCVTLKNYVGVYGGFAGTETARSQRNWVSNKTILDGNLQDSVVSCPTGCCSATVIDGFTIQGGDAYMGGGVYCYLSSITIANNIIQNNTACVGAGAYLSGNNTQAVSPILVNNVIANNDAVYSTQYPNVTSVGGGIYMFRSNATITGNTVVGNSADNWGSGIAMVKCASAIKNNIVAFNSYIGIAYEVEDDGSVLDYNDVFGNGTCNYWGLTPGSHSISVEPAFCDYDGGDYHLTHTSPCVDAGLNTASAIPALDFDGKARIIDGNSDGTATVDMGAYEFRRFCVSKSGLDSNDGSSWNLAKLTVAGGLSCAARGDEVWVAQGTYNESGLQLHNGIKLLGGFAGTGATRDWNTYVTALSSSQYNATVITTDQASTLATLLEGFTITGFQVGNGGGGCWIRGAATIRYNIFSNCLALAGGAILINGSPWIVNNVFSGNMAWGPGGAILAYGNSIITNNTFRNNTSYASGGALYIDGGSPILSNNIVAGSTAGYGIYCYGTTTSTLSHNDVYGNSPGNYYGVSAGSGDISVDPGFTDLWHIPSTSPCYDTGIDNPLGLPASDLDGQARLYGAHVDMGADEYHP